MIVLEDDLFVSAEFYQYAQQAYAFYKHEEKVAGIALYHNTFNEVAYCPFEPVHDGTDVYFMQVPCSWGQLWTKEQWQLFRSYQQKETTTDDSLLPPTVQQWPDASSWKKIFYRYLAKTNRYFVYPRIGLSTNFGDPGQHLTNAQSNFQTPVLLGRKEIHFSSFNAALSIYDGYYEPSGVVYNRRFQKNISVTFDLNGTKSLKNISTEYLLSCKQCKHPEQQFGVACYPYENNVFLSLTAETGESCFSLGKTSMFTDENSF